MTTVVSSTHTRNVSTYILDITENLGIIRF